MTESEQALSPLDLKSHSHHSLFNDSFEMGRVGQPEDARRSVKERFGRDRPVLPLMSPVDGSSSESEVDDFIGLSEDSSPEKMKDMDALLVPMSRLGVAGDRGSHSNTPKGGMSGPWHDHMAIKAALVNGAVFGGGCYTPSKHETNGVTPHVQQRRPLPVLNTIPMHEVSNQAYWYGPPTHPPPPMRPPITNTFPTNVYKRGQMSAPITPVVMPQYPVGKYNRSVSMPVPPLQPSIQYPFRPTAEAGYDDHMASMQDRKMREMSDHAQVPSMETQYPGLDMMKGSDSGSPPSYTSMTSMTKGRTGRSHDGRNYEMNFNGLDDQLVPSPIIPQTSRNLHHAVDRYSRKVFVGGLPPDIDEEEINLAFRRFGALVVDWPHKAESKSYFPPKGYCFLIFQDELSVHTLISACYLDDNKLYWCVSSPTMRDKPVQIRPWNLNDSDFVMDGSQTLDPRKTIFVGGVPRPLRAVQLAVIMDRLYSDVCYAGIDTDPELKYPKGAGRVAFSSQHAYIAAISARFVQLQLGEIDKRVEVKPYVLDDQMCDECGGARCNGKFAPFFCANVTCLQYYCETCWSQIHTGKGREFHKPLVKEGTDRPRTVPFRWV